MTESQEVSKSDRFGVGGLSAFAARGRIGGLSVVTTRRALALLLATAVSLGPLVAGTGAAPAASAGATAPYRPGIVLVGFRPGVSGARERALERAVLARSKGSLGGASRATRRGHRLARRFGDLFVLRVPRTRVMWAVRLLRRYRRWVRFAEPDYVMHASGVQNTPNDPSFGLQWGSLNTGQVVNGTSGIAGADDRAASAWATSTGSRSIVIGEVDTGVEYTHPDLAANIWSNPGGVGGCSAGTHGYNVVAGTCDPMDDDTVYGGHGTHVAGIMGALGNNRAGVAGMNWSTTILPVKWLDSNASGSTTQLISALDWLVKAEQAGVNVRVVNDSATFVGTAFSQALSDEIDLLGANNILFVTAAGNTGQDNDNPAYTRYPCGYDRPTEICVTASDQRDQLPSWANWGVSKVDLAAPGANIYSTLRGASYGYIDGGSMAAAQVSGAAALILSTASMTPTTLKADILGNVDPLPSLSGLVRTGGRLDVCQAIPGCASAPPPPPVNVGLPSVAGSAQSGQTLMASAGSWSNGPTGFGYVWERCDSGGANCAVIGGAAGSSYVVQAADVSSTLRVVVTASNGGGSSAPAASAQTAVVTAGVSTFGSTGVGGSSDAFAANRKRVSAYSLPGSGSVTKLSVYLAPTSTGGVQDLEGVLYADSGGAPGALLGTTSQLVFSSTGSAGWYDLTFPSAVGLSAGRYWIGVITGGTSGVIGFRYTNVSGSRDYDVNAYSAGPTSPFGSVSSDSEQMSLYATYTPG